MIKLGQILCDRDNNLFILASLMEDYVGIVSLDTGNPIRTLRVFDEDNLLDYEVEYLTNDPVTHLTEYIPCKVDMNIAEML